MDVIASSACYLDEFMWMLGEKKHLITTCIHTGISEQYPLFISIHFTYTNVQCVQHITNYTALISVSWAKESAGQMFSVAVFLTICINN